MPRQGDGSSDNGPFEEASHNIAHGAGGSDTINRADKAAPLPEGLQEHGKGLPGMSASAGGGTGTQSGKGGEHSRNPEKLGTADPKPE
ncbi:hypothetical protein M011DRAFT_476564 [Sporormia fimetaria CBS 119925]|uniref:Uncharacterized protein n=1 Tax=Sporormia fimetaria CBS 119925 TaxID=1340428 RepID=A0A6A6VDS7_9PLEO|nr:hypothetical protein M011DRAFT_476564 [Sporormia fimetaria CBS 119925]